MLMTGLLQSIAPRQVAKKDGSGFWTFYDATIDGKKYQVTQATFNQAIGLVNTAVQADVDNEQRNGYDNWKAHVIIPASSNAVAASQLVGAAATNQAMQAVVGAREAQERGPVPTQAEKDRNASICRQTACKVTASLLASDPALRLDTFFDVAGKIATFMETGVKPGEVAVVEALASELEATPMGDDDIPF